MVFLYIIIILSINLIQIYFNDRIKSKSYLEPSSRPVNLALTSQSLWAISGSNFFLGL